MSEERKRPEKKTVLPIVSKKMRMIKIVKQSILLKN
jgi:hypothetical protein